MKTFIASLFTLKLVSLKFFNFNRIYSNKSFELKSFSVLVSRKLLINSYPCFLLSHFWLNKESTISFPRSSFILSNLGSSVILFDFSLLLLLFSSGLGPSPSLCSCLCSCSCSKASSNFFWKSSILILGLLSSSLFFLIKFKLLKLFIVSFILFNVLLISFASFDITSLLFSITNGFIFLLSISSDMNFLFESLPFLPLDFLLKSILPNSSKSLSSKIFFCLVVFSFFNFLSLISLSFFCNIFSCSSKSKSKLKFLEVDGCIGLSSGSM